MIIKFLYPGERIKTSKLPKNEKKRLEVLAELDILDTLEEQCYDDLTHLAALVCNTPISLVSFIDKDRQWFKSHKGISVRETPRDYAFCSHAILDNKIFNIQDSEKDERFIKNPLVTGNPKVKFYAGVPLELEGGLRVGTLCVIDNKPRILSEDQIYALECIAKQVKSLLELRLKLKRVEESEKKQLSNFEALTFDIENRVMIERTQEAAKIGSWQVDLTNYKCFWSKMTYKIHEEELGKEIFIEDGINYYLDDHVPIIQEHVEMAISDFTPWDAELQIKTAKGNIKWVRAIGHPVVFDNTVIRLEGTFQDITDQKNIEQQTQDLNRRLTLALKASHVGVWDWNLVTNELIWDNQMYKLYGAEGCENSDSYSIWESRLHPEDINNAKKEIEEAILGKKKFDTDFRIIRPCGKNKNIRALADIFYDDNQKPVKMIGVNWDITEVINSREILADSKNKAEDLLKAKSFFLANMSHEIRTPLNGILGFSELLLDQELSEISRDYVNHIKSSSDALLLILNDILDFSKIEAGKLSIEKISADIEKVIKASIFTFSSIATQKNVKLSYHISDDIPKNMMCDPLRLRQILLNLIGNAVKFTEKGTIKINIEKGREINEHDFEVIFKVMDTGVGIPSESVGKLFSCFEQVDSSTSRKFGGTGLGLSICAKLVSLMGGEIWVDSKLNSGSTFSFSIVTCSAESIKTENSIKKTSHSVGTLSFENNLKILIAEDNQINQKLIKKILKKFGYVSIDIVDNGIKAVAACRSKSYDLIFMDIQMPEMDGNEATRIIRKESKLELKIVGLSANAYLEDKNKAKEAGMNEYIEKPINILKLGDMIKKFEKIKKKAA